MKILIIDTVCGYGSTGKIVVDLASEYEKAGHDCVIAFGRGKAKGYGKVYKIGTTIGIYYHALMTRLFDTHGKHSKMATKKFIKYIDEFAPDIIHLHNIHGYFLNYEYLFKYIKNKNSKVVWTLHDCWSFTGHCAYFDVAGCFKWQTNCQNCPQKHSYPKSWLLDGSKRNFLDKKAAFEYGNVIIVTPSLWLKELVGQSFLKNNRTEVIPNGIDIEKIKCLKEDFRNDNRLAGKKIILGVANLWDYRKGLDSFLALSKMINKDEIIVLVGVSKAQLKKLPDNIVGIKRTDSFSQLIDIYKSADVFVNPTLEDNYPTVNIEAIISGTPVVTYNTGGSPESLLGKYGLIVEKGNVEELYKAITAILKDGKEKYLIGTDKKYFSYKYMSEQYLNIFKKEFRT